MLKTTLLIVDDHLVVRTGLAAILGLEKDLSVVGEAGGGREAVKLAAELKPDVVILDFSMPDMDGADATAEILRVSPRSRILILTSYGTSADLRRALDAGATSAVTKNLSRNELLSAIHKTAAGIRRLSPEIAATISETEAISIPQGRHREALLAVIRGLSNDEIATLLGLSKARIKQLLNETYAMLGAANRAEAVAIALRLGIAAN